MVRTSAIALVILLVAVICAEASGWNDVPGVYDTRRPVRRVPQPLGGWIVADTQCVGLGYDGTHFWVSAGDQMSGHCTFYVYTDRGTFVGSWQQQDAWGWGYRDLCHSGQYVWGSQGHRIRAFDDRGNYQGYFNGPIDPCRALAYDGEYWYTCGFGQPLYRAWWNGAWGATPNWQAITSSPVYGAYGLAYDRIQDCLWLTETGAAGGYLCKFTPRGSLLDRYEFPPRRSKPAGCAMAQTNTYGHVLAVLHQGEPYDSVILYDVGSRPVDPESWNEIKERLTQGQWQREHAKPALASADAKKTSWSSSKRTPRDAKRTTWLNAKRAPSRR